MVDVKQQMIEASNAYKAGQKSKARELLSKIVEVDERNEKAWFLLSAVVDTAADQVVCLENVLTINPNNEKARERLKILQDKLGKKSSPTGTISPFASTGGLPPSPSKTDPKPAPDTGDIGWSSFLDDRLTSASNTGSSVKSSAPSPAASPFGVTPTPTKSTPSGSSWDEFLSDSSPSSSTSDAYVPSSSVDWGKDSAAPAALGSGRNVPQPSPAQYDDWISSLGIGKEPTPAAPGWEDLSASADPFGISAMSAAPAADGWGDLKSNDDPFGSSSPSGAANATDGWSDFAATIESFSKDASPKSGSVLGEGWGEYAADIDSADPFGPSRAASLDALESSKPDIAPFSVDYRVAKSEPGRRGKSALGDSALTEMEDAETRALEGRKKGSKAQTAPTAIEDDDPFDDSFLASIKPEGGAKAKKRAGKAVDGDYAQYKKFFELIPSEITIETAGQGGAGRRFFNVLVLLGLNIAAGAGLYLVSQM